MQVQELCRGALIALFTCPGTSLKPKNRQSTRGSRPRIPGQSQPEQDRGRNDGRRCAQCAAPRDMYGAVPVSPACTTLSTVCRLGTLEARVSTI